MTTNDNTPAAPLYGATVGIGSYLGWDLFYDPSTDSFEAQKGRKHRVEKYRQHLIATLDKEAQAEHRAKSRVLTCKFRWWNLVEQVEHAAELTSYSDRGAALKTDGAHGATVYIGGHERVHTIYDPKDKSQRCGVLVIPAGVDARPLYEASEHLRRAKEAYRLLVQQLTRPVYIGERYSRGAVDIEAEVKLRATINAASGHVGTEVPAEPGPS